MGSSYKTIRDIGIIGLSQVLTNMGSFLLLPIITKSLGAYDYGIWSQISITVSLLTPLAVMGLSMGIVRFLSGEKDVRKTREVFYSVFFIVFFSGLLVSLLLYMGADFLASKAFDDPSSAYYIKCGSLLVLLSATTQIGLYYFRIFQKITTFASLSIFKSVGHLIFTIILLYSGFGLLSIIFSLLTVELIMLAASMLLVFFHIGFSFPSFRGIGEILRYSLPLTPNAAIKWVTDSSDRYMVTYFMGLGSVGVYSASYGIGNLISLLVYPIQLILFPELSRLYNQEKHDEVKNYLSYSLKYFLFISIPAVFGLALLSKPLLLILTTSEFVSGSIVIPFIALSGLMAGVFQIFINITHLVKKTQFNLLIHFFAAAVNIVLNFVLIPSWGIVGAAVATFCSYLLMVVICIHVSFKYIKIDIDWIFILKCLISSSLMYLLLSLLDFSNVRDLILSTLLGISLYIVFNFIFKTFSDKELRVLKQIKLMIKTEK